VAMKKAVGKQRHRFGFFDVALIKAIARTSK
jgi:hypothetical protein